MEVPINEHCKYQSDKEGASVCAGEPKGGFDGKNVSNLIVLPFYLSSSSSMPR